MAFGNSTWVFGGKLLKKWQFGNRTDGEEAAKRQRMAAGCIGPLGPFSVHLRGPPIVSQSPHGLTDVNVVGNS